MSKTDIEKVSNLKIKVTCNTINNHVCCGCPIDGEKLLLTLPTNVPIIESSDLRWKNNLTQSLSLKYCCRCNAMHF